MDLGPVYWGPMSESESRDRAELELYFQVCREPNAAGPSGRERYRKGQTLRERAPRCHAALLMALHATASLGKNGSCLEPTARACLALLHALEESGSKHLSIVDCTPPPFPYHPEVGVGGGCGGTSGAGNNTIVAGGGGLGGGGGTAGSGGNGAWQGSSNLTTAVNQLLEIHGQSDG